jgi:hypothetical protein
MTTGNANSFRYDIDKNDRIVWVSSNWDDFALSNAGWNMRASDVLTRPLMDFITGDETRIIWRHLLAKVRRSGQQISLPFRCDGPAFRRFMDMTIRPMDNQGIKFISTILLEEKRHPVALLDISAPRSHDQLIICSWCNRTKFDNDWVELDDVIRRKDIFAGSVSPLVTHGICGSCSSLLEAAGG